MTIDPYAANPEPEPITPEVINKVIRVEDEYGIKAEELVTHVTTRGEKHAELVRRIAESR